MDLSFKCKLLYPRGCLLRGSCPPSFGAFIRELKPIIVRPVINKFHHALNSVRACAQSVYVIDYLMLRLHQLSRELNKRNYEFIIVGAGIGGLYAAQLLAENGVTNFLILEAQEGVGGRIETMRLGELNETNKYKWIRKNSFLSSFAIEKGATWLQESHTLMLHLASTMGISVRKQYRQGVSTYLTKDRVFTSEDLLTIPELAKPILEFIDKFMEIAREYEKHVLGKTTLDEDYRRMVAKYDSITLTQFLEQEIESPFVRYFIHNFLEHIECMYLSQDSVHEILLRAAKSGDIETLTQFLRLQEEPSYLVDGGTQMYLEKFQERMEKATGLMRDELIRFEEEVIAIDNSIKNNIKVRSNRHGKIIEYTCKEVIMTAPIGIMSKIHISNLSLAKRFIFSNQTRNLVTKSFIIARRPFWKDQCTGDGLYSEEYNISMSHDVSPPNNECGVLVFFHCGKKYDQWHKQFPLTMQNRTESIRKYYKSVLAKMYLKGNEDSPELQDIIYLNSSLIDNRFVMSGFQSNCKPGTLTSLMQMGEVFHRYYDDENGIIFVGSQFGEDFNSYMQGAVRSASKKIHNLLGKVDPMLELQRQANEKKVRKIGQLVTIRK